MKIKIFITLFISLMIFGCEKENDPEPVNDPEPDNIVDESIIYTLLEPNIQVTSVDTLLYHNSGCGYIPSPSDTIASISLDINNDNEVDFMLSCSSWYNFVSASGPCANYNTNIFLSGTSEDNKVAISENYNVVEPYELNDVIDTSQIWSNTAMLMLSSASAPFSTNFNDTVYLGLKIETEEGSFLGWIYLDKNGYDVTVISYAINQEVSSQISAGQIE